MKKRIIIFFFLLILAAAGFFAWEFTGPAVKIRDANNPYLYIKTGSTAEDVKKELLSNQFLTTTNWYDMVAKLMKYKNVRPGRYKLKEGMSLVDLVRMLRNGNQAILNFTITKVRTKEALASRIGKTFETDSLQMINFLNNSDSLKKYGLDTNTVMTVAIPLTYPIKWNTTAAGIFEHFYTAYKAFWTDERKSKAQSLGLSLVQVSTLASIVDEETNAASDKPNVASVYLNRINKGIPLQADPTIKFALKDFGLKRVLNKHIDAAAVSPYSTYEYKGLPPGPICTPQLSTIDSVLNSPKTDYFYFVANPAFDGTHIFTTNLGDHHKQARLYHKELNKRNIK
jgi:UPF0755 protein